MILPYITQVFYLMKLAVLTSGEVKFIFFNRNNELFY
jgi:hypothetical protein